MRETLANAKTRVSTQYAEWVQSLAAIPNAPDAYRDAVLAVPGSGLILESVLDRMISKMECRCRDARPIEPADDLNSEPNDDNPAGEFNHE